MKEDGGMLYESIRSGDLAVEFFSLADRIGHRFISYDGEHPRPLLESIEGDTLDIWPPSPAFQEIDTESRLGGGQVSMLVGQAGTNHWSASFESDASGNIVADVACRVKSGPGSLTSSYRITDAQNDPICRIRAERCEQNVCSVIQNGDRLIIAPTGQISSIPQTLRWRYLVRGD